MRMKRSGVMRKKLFTLIELLVVIAIIAILASLLLPALKAAKDKTMAIVCGNKQRQLHLSFMDYIQDNNDQFPPCLSPSNQKWWDDSPFNTDYLCLGTYYTPGSAILKPDNKVHCTRNMITYNPDKFINYVLLQNINKKIPAIKTPSQKIYLMEAGLENHYQFWETDSDLTFGWRAVMGRPHSAKGNTLFVDGHVSAGSPNELDNNNNFRINY
jgi:prepilin-type N-terminal cleavage/methylation domain-containing protein/prepilin-type processing-associated H-X9-DG protein